MSKEEAIEIVKEITFVRGIRHDVEGEREDLLALEEVLNLIDKLQKENEELHKQVDIEFVEENYIEKSKVVSKNKIRDKIKEVAEEPQIYVDTEKFDIEFEKSNFTIKVLSELLRE